jgi:Ca2+-binding RTX toxin-like protein
VKSAAIKLACAAVVAFAALLGAPAIAPAFQNVTIENGTLRITGDAGKTTDLVTIKYDPVADEYVITHDILSAPPGCHFEGNGPPYKLLRCPAKGIGLIVVDTGNDSDTFRLEDMVYTNLNQEGIWYPPDLLEVVILMGTGNDKYQEITVAPPTLPPAAALAKRSIDMGGGNDGAVVGPGANKVVFGDGSAKLAVAAGTNTIAVGAGNSKVELAGGVNSVTVGPGNSQVTATDGTNNVSFGSGASKFTGGPGADVAVFGPGTGTFTGNGGDDRAFFGPGVNHFYGGPGADFASLGPGNDFGFGGTGADKLLGGPGIDRLFGGADFDVLNGGPGKPDRCYGGAGGAKPISCEFGVQYMPY